MFPTRIEFAEDIRRVFFDLFNSMDIYGHGAGVITAGIITDSILPKAVMSQIPLSIFYDAKVRHQRLLKNPLLWRGWIELYKYRNRNYTPEPTKEIDYESNCTPLSPDGLDDIKGSVILVATVQTYLSVLNRIGAYLATKGYKVCLLVPYSTSGWKGVENPPHGVRVVFIESLIYSGWKSYFDMMLERFAFAWKDMSIELERGRFPYLRDIIHAKPLQLKFILTEVAAQTSAYYLLADHIINTLSPEAVFVARLKRITESVFSRAASARNVPVFLMNHGHFSDSWSPISLGDIAGVCSHIILWNDRQREMFCRLFPGLDAKKIHVTGGIQWDEPIKRAISNKSTDRVVLRKEIAGVFSRHSEDIDIDLRWITVIMDEDVSRMLNLVLEALNNVRDGGFHLIIRPRSEEIRMAYNRVFTRILNFPVSIFTWDIGIPLSDLLYCSDMAITHLSTGNIDSLCAGTPVCTIELDKRSRVSERFVHLEEFGLPLAASIDELSGIVRDVVMDGERMAGWRDAAKRAAKALMANYPKADAAEGIERLLRDAAAA